MFHMEYLFWFYIGSCVPPGNPLYYSQGKAVSRFSLTAVSYHHKFYLVRVPLFKDLLNPIQRLNWSYVRVLTIWLRVSVSCSPLISRLFYLWLAISFTEIKQVNDLRFVLFVSAMHQNSLIRFLLPYTLDNFRSTFWVYYCNCVVF